MDAKLYYPYLLAAVSQDNVLPLTSTCNLGCIFCSHRQNPPEIETFRLPHLPAGKALELAGFLSPARKIVIGESATRLDEGEPFTHPELLLILRELRRMFPVTPLAVTTNGTLLTQHTIAQLAVLQPLELTISLNSATAAGRRLLLSDTEPARAPEAVARLASAGIPFHGSLVAMPHLVGIDDIEETVRFLAAHGALSVRVFLPGYTKHAPAELCFPLTLWNEMIALALTLSRELGVPVTPEPAAPDNFTPEVYGVMRDTPAARAGILPGDIIVSVNDKNSRTRVEAFHQVRKTANPFVRVQRGIEEAEFIIRKERGQAPGFVVLSDFDPCRLDDISVEIRRSKSLRPLLLVSQFGEPLLRRAAALLNLPPVSVLPVHNHYFGGSIMSAGLLTVSDLLAAARTAQQDFDLILVPREAFDHTGRDLTGKRLSEMEEETGIPVRAV